jgi:hypothetical protein
MAEDIFLNFFQGLGTGMEAGRERRTLMQRAQQGKISPQEVPGRFETMLTAMARASTPDSTRLAQDKLKLETAKFALEKSLGERKQASLELKTLADLELANKEAEDEKNDTFLFTVKQNEARKAFLTGGMSEVYKLDIPKFNSADFTKSYTDFLKQLEATDLSNRIDEMEGTQALLLRLKVPEDQIPTNLAAAKDMLDQKLGIREAERKLEAAEKTIEMAKERRATSVTVQTGGGQFTFNPTPKETADVYTKPELADKIVAVRKNLADAQRYDSGNSKAIDTITDTLQMLTSLAEAKGWTEIIPGYQPPPPPEPEPGPPAPVPESVAGMFPIPAVERPAPSMTPVPKVGGSLYQRYLQTAD